MKRISVRNNNDRCLIRFTHQSIQYSLTLGDFNNSVEKAKAEQIALEISLSIQNGSFNGIEQWKVKRIDFSRRNVIEALGEHNSSLTNALCTHLKNYKGELRNSIEASSFINSLECSTATKRRYLTAIRSIPSLKGIFKEVKIKAKKGESRKSIDPFTTNEINRIKEAIKDNHYESYVLFCLHTGCRPSEAIGLRWCDVEFENERIRIAQSLSRKPGSRERVRKETKTGVERYFPLNDELMRIINSSGCKSIDGLLFASVEGLPIDDQTFATRQWKKILTKAEVRYRSPYNLRHTFISHALKAMNGDVVQIAQWVGNSPEIIYKHYAGLVSDVKLPSLY